MADIAPTVSEPDDDLPVVKEEDWRWYIAAEESTWGRPESWTRIHRNDQSWD